jgi:hypothetical protein
MDVSEKSMRMPRNSALLYPNQAPRSGADWAYYRGVLRMLDGRLYWAGIWQRICNGRMVLELKLELKEEPAKPPQAAGAQASERQDDEAKGGAACQGSSDRGKEGA